MNYVVAKLQPGPYLWIKLASCSRYTGPFSSTALSKLGLFTGQERRIAEIASQFLADSLVDPIYTHPGLCLTA